MLTLPRHWLPSSDPVAAGADRAAPWAHRNYRRADGHVHQNVSCNEDGTPTQATLDELASCDRDIPMRAPRVLYRAVLVIYEQLPPSLDLVAEEGASVTTLDVALDLVSAAAMLRANGFGRVPCINELNAPPETPAAPEAK